MKAILRSGFLALAIMALAVPANAGPYIDLEPRFVIYTGEVLTALGIILGLVAGLQKGPVGGRFSGKAAADGSGRQGPLPGHEPDSVVRRRRNLTILAILCVVVGVGLVIAASEMQVSQSQITPSLGSVWSTQGHSGPDRRGPAPRPRVDGEASEMMAAA